MHRNFHPASAGILARYRKPTVSKPSLFSARGPCHRHFNAVLHPQINYYEARVEPEMKYGYALLARLGLFTQKSEGPDVFDLRLQRIGSRERQRKVRPILFKPPPQLMDV